MAGAEHKGVKVEERGPVRVLTLSNPARRNALDPELVDALLAALARPRPEPARVLLLRGAGEKAFCSGYDLNRLEPPREGDEPVDAPLQRLFRALEEQPAPTVAMIRGSAFGAGCELACACDFRVLSTDAVLCFPPARLGVVYAPEGLLRLTSLVGLPFAKRMFLTGRRVSADEAKARGLADEVAAPEKLEEAASALCDELAAGAPLAVSGMRRGFLLLQRVLGALPRAEAEALEALRRQAFASEDAQEGVRALLERRAPRFEGR